MDGILTKNLYYGCIKKMDKQEYLNEKKNLDKLSIVEQEMMKIKNGNNYNYNNKTENDVMDLNDFLKD